MQDYTQKFISCLGLYSVPTPYYCSTTKNNKWVTISSVTDIILLSTAKYLNVYHISSLQNMEYMFGLRSDIKDADADG